MLTSRQKEARARKIQITIIALILIADIIFLPWVLKFPYFFKIDIKNAPEVWLNYGYIQAWKDMLIDNQFQKAFLAAQAGVLALIVHLIWGDDNFRKTPKTTDGVGGPEASGYGQYGTGRWQSKKERDITTAVWFSDKPLNTGGIVLGMERRGRHKEKIWLESGDTHSLIIGTTRSGKSRKILLPSIWAMAKAGESMVITDPKGELFLTTKPYLKQQGYRIITINLREPLYGNQWNPLNCVIKAVESGDTAKATEQARDIANIMVNCVPAVGEPIWRNGAESTITALIMAVCMEADNNAAKNMATVYYLLSIGGQVTGEGKLPLSDYLDTLPLRHPARTAFATAAIAPYRTRGSFFTTVLSDMRLFVDPYISDMTSGQDHDFQNIGTEKTVVFLIVPDETSTRNVLASICINQLYQALSELAIQNGGRLKRRVNFVLDEFGNLPMIPDFDKKLTVAGGRNIRFHVAIQDIAQLKKYGHDAQTITGNCHTWIYLLTSDYETARLISEKCGKYTIETSSTSSSRQEKRYSVSQGITYTGRPLVMPDEVLRWPQNEALVMRVRQHPARYPVPDLSEYRANIDFGFPKPTKNVRHDIEVATEILMQRKHSITQRTMNETPIWLPPGFTSEVSIEDSDIVIGEIGDSEVTEQEPQEPVEDFL